MVINSTGALLEVFMIKTLTVEPTRNCIRVQDVVRHKLLSVMLFSGLGGTSFTDIMLWADKADSGIVDGLENGILAWNILYGSSATLVSIHLIKKFVILQK